jgi:hypothetical protein
MPLLLLRRLAIIATAILFVAPAPTLSLSARADDAPKRADESAVLDRVFANWKARHDSVHSLHFTVDCRMTFPKGTFDFTSTSNPLPRFDHDQVLEQFGVQFWIEGERLCVVTTPMFKVPQAQLTDARRVAMRYIADEQTTSNFYASAPYETGAAPRPFARYGFVHHDPDSDSRSLGSAWLPFFLALRPQFPGISWRREQCHVVEEKAIIDGIPCVKFERALDPTRMYRVKREEACWVSPGREDVIVHWTMKTQNCVGSIKYKKDKTWGWIPSEWSVETKGIELYEYKVTDYAINEKIDPAIFAHEFPPGTPVADQSDGGPKLSRTMRYFVAEPDGSKREISLKEYKRLKDMHEPRKNDAPAKQGSDKAGTREPRTQ